MPATTVSSTVGQLSLLRRLTAALGQAVTPDDVARATLPWTMQIDGVVRAGLAVTEAAGRRLKFVSTDLDAIGPTGVRWCHIDGLADVPLARAVREGVPVFCPTLEELTARYPDMGPRQGDLGTRSLLALPLNTDQLSLGGLLLSFGSPRRLDAGQQAFFGAAAAQVTQTLHRALAYQVEHTTSERLQRSLMPQSLPDLTGLALGAYYQPGGANVDVGGDWYDVVPLDDGSVVVALGDVMGKGVAAATVMGQVRTAMRAYALLDPSPSLLLRRLDALVLSLGVPEQIVTMACGLVSPWRRQMALAVAGHPPPLRVDTPGGAAPAAVEVEVGPPLGLGSGQWPETTLDLPPDLTVLFYSDGLVESRVLDFETGLAQLREHIVRAQVRKGDPRELCARLGEHMWRHDTEDDVTLLAVASTGSRLVRSATSQLPADPSAAPLARRFVSDCLRQWQLDDDVTGTAELCVSELVTNAVIHSGTPPKVTVRLDGARLLVLVQDNGKHGTVRVNTGYEPDDISGRGLTLISALTSAWSAEHNADGTTVWFELDTGGPAAD